MMLKQNYLMLKEKYGKVGSWAIWTPRDDDKIKTEKADDLNWANDEETLLNTINPNYVFVGLNASRKTVEKDWSAFHCAGRGTNDYKIRYALEGTRFWGAYMTDIIKEHIDPNSKKVEEEIKKHPEMVELNKLKFEEELSYLNPDIIIIAFGRRTEKILKKWFNDREIVGIYHFANYCDEEKYKQRILKTLESV